MSRRGWPCALLLLEPLELTDAEPLDAAGGIGFAALLELLAPLELFAATTGAAANDTATDAAATECELSAGRAITAGAGKRVGNVFGFDED